MEQKQLLEQEGKALGLDIKTEWLQFTSGTPMNEALISGNLDFASGGVGPLLSIWGKTRENLGVKAVAALNSMPLYLNSIDPGHHPADGGRAGIRSGPGRKIGSPDRIARASRRHGTDDERQIGDQRAFRLGTVHVPGTRGQARPQGAR